jgi:DNA gyrase subunit B
MAKRKSAQAVYDERSIRVMKGLEGVRKRPSMYIGDIGPDGFNHLVMEILDNSVDEAVAGYAKHIRITFHDDGSVTVEDDGRGVPVGMHPTEKKPTVDVVMTMLHAGGKFGGSDSPFKTSGGLHGVGAAVVNALSEWMEVRVKRNKKQYYRRYVKSKPDAKKLKIEKRNLGKRDTGTTVTFMPDKSIFAKGVEFSQSFIVRRLRELAYLNAGVEFTLDWRGSVTVFKSEGGLQEYVEYLANGKMILHEPVCVSCEDLDGCSVDMAFAYDAAYDSEVHSFANNIPTIEGGVHHNAALDALCKVIATLSASMRDFKKSAGEPNKSDVMEGLNLVVSVRVAEPQFGGQTKTKLGNNELRAPLGTWMQEKIEKYLRSKRDIAKVVITKVVEAMMARDAARKAKSLTRKKSAVETLTLPGKLADCTSKDPELCEIYIVEGDSAGGTAKQARDKLFQAVLPIKGKVLNVNKATIGKVLGNAEIGTLITALNVRVTQREVYLDELRYHKIVICADADPDGGHITCLLLALFYKYMRRLIEQGHLYICELPLYRVLYRGKSHYLKDDDALADFRDEHPGKMEVSRFKGLGEMNDEQLQETAMDPKTRQLRMIHIEDAKDAAEMLECLMGSDVEGRKKFVHENIEFEDEE